MRRIRKRVIAAGILLAGIVIGAVIYFAFTIHNVTVEGTTHFTEDEIEHYIFQKEMDYHLAVFFAKTMLGRKESIPFVEDYDVEFTGRSSVNIVIYEKSLIGYVSYMGTNFYLDKDGYAVESSDAVLEGVPYITGLNYDYIILNEQVPVADTKTFDVLLDLAQLLKKHNLSVNRIYVEDNLALTLHIGDVRVNLGNDNMLAEKIAELKDIEPNLKGYSGTLDMTVYKEDNSGYTLKSDKYLGTGAGEDGNQEDGNDGSTDPNGNEGEGSSEPETPNKALEGIDDEKGISYMDENGDEPISE